MIEDYFENIDTKDKAYWLGFLAADGYNNVSRNMIRIWLSVKDEILIDKFIQCLNIEVKKKYINREYKFKNNEKETISKTKSVILEFTNKKISGDLSSYGCASPKTFNITPFSCDNDELELAWLMGYYDGDGAANSCILCSADYNFLTHIKNKYKLKFKVKEDPNPYGFCYILNIGAKFKRKLMENYKNSLERKRKTCYDDKGCKTTGKYPERFSQRKFNPSKEELEKLLNMDKLSFIKIGKIFNVSDVSVRKRCIKMGII